MPDRVAADRPPADCEVFIVIGILGKGGMTAAVFNRARMFVESGLSVRIVTLEHDPEHDRRNADYEHMGWRDDRVEILNAFEARKSRTPPASRAHVRLNRLKSAASRFRKVVDLADEKQYVDPRGVLRRVDSLADSGRIDFTTEHDHRGNPRMRTHYDSAGVMVSRQRLDGLGRILEEQFLTSTGVPYAARTYDPSTGKPSTFYLVDRRGRKVRKYASHVDWQAEWMTGLAKNVKGDAIFICDGPGSAGKVFRIPRDQAATIYMVHNNHYKSPYVPGSVVREDHVSIFKRMKQMDALVVLTPEQAADIGGEFGETSRIRVIPNSVSIRRVESPERRDNVVTMFSRLVYQKNLIEAVEVFARVVEKFPSAILEIYGEGTWKGRLERRISELGLNESVLVMGYTKDASRQMASSTAVLCTSHYEGLPVNFLEAYRSGTPVVSYACRYGPRDLIDDGETGYVVDQGDQAALADRIVSVLRDPALARGLGEAGQAKILSRYANSVVREEWFSVLGDVVESLRRRQRASS